MQVRITTDNNGSKWVRCGGCGHKLCRIVSDDFQIHGIEFKCHSCKIENIAKEVNKDDVDSYGN